MTLPAAEQWLRLESEDITVLTDAAEKQALRTILKGTLTDLPPGW